MSSNIGSIFYVVAMALLASEIKRRRTMLQQIEQRHAQEAALLFKNSAALLEGSHDVLEKLLEEASSFAMCTRRHKSQSPAILKEWLEMISNTSSDSELVSIPTATVSHPYNRISTNR
jgi:hypothetical protein